MSCLSKDAIYTIDPFFYNGIFVNFKIFISLLERIYNNASYKHIAIAKLKNL